MNPAFMFGATHGNPGADLEECLEFLQANTYTADNHDYFMQCAHLVEESQQDVSPGTAVFIVLICVVCIVGVLRI